MPNSGGESKRQLLYALRRVLRPIVRLLIRAGISYCEFADVARGAFVESAVRDRIGYSGAPTRDHIALVTGIGPQQVDYYIDNKNALPKAEPTLGRVLIEVLHRWHSDPQYLGPYGIPLELELDSPPQRCIESLVAQVDSKAKPGIVLEQLLQAKSVTYTGEKHFRVLRRSFIPPHAYSSDRLEYFGATLARMVQTLEHNVRLAEREKKRLERFAFADRGLPEGILAQFQAYASERTDKFLADIDDWFAHHASPDSDRLGPRVETGIHVFLHVEPQSSTRHLSDLAQSARKFDAAL